MTDPQAAQNVSVEQNGRVLTGGPGTSIEALEQAIERTTPEQDGTEKPEAAQPASDSKPTRGQARFSELTKERDSAKQAQKEANERAIALEARLKAIEERTAQAGTPGPDVSQSRAADKTSSQQEAVPSVSRPKPSEDEVGTTYKTYGDYVEDLTEWKAEQREHRANQERAHATRVEKWTAERTTAAALYPDFDAVLKTGPGSDIDLSPDPERAVARVQMLMEIPGGAHVVYKLAKDATEAARLATLDDRAFGFAIARLLPPETNGATPASPSPRASKAPAPFQPVGASSKTTAMTSADAAAKGNYEEYRRLRALERGVKPRYK